VWFVIAQRAPKSPQSFSGQNGQISIPNATLGPELGRGTKEFIMNWVLYRSHSLP